MPNFKLPALKFLGQPYSSLCCERKWSTYFFILLKEDQFILGTSKGFGLCACWPSFTILIYSTSVLKPGELMRVLSTRTRSSKALKIGNSPKNDKTSVQFLSCTQLSSDYKVG